MLTRWVPWKFIIKRAAKRFGIIDPIKLAARIRRFSQPSEVQEPIELLRAGIIFHARGLVNTKAIQYNLDWIWPYWVQRQFNPSDYSFIPRGFAFSHVNLTHRNWTAVGHPDLQVYPIMDPRGLVTPLYDGWSVDCWIIDANGRPLIPSALENSNQHLDMDENALRLVHQCSENNMDLETGLQMQTQNSSGYAQIDYTGRSAAGGWLVVALRPYNPEGIQFIESIEFQNHARPFWLVNRHTRVYMDQEPDKILFSDYGEGDVFGKWADVNPNVKRVKCRVGMATSAAFFRLEENQARRIRVSVDLENDMPPASERRKITLGSWQEHLSDTARLRVPDEKIQFLYDTAVRSLLLLSAGDPVPGPYTYNRFWFRDACLMLNAMMTANMCERSRIRIDRFPRRQGRSGYFRSQEGEWDSNGQVLWIMHRYLELTGTRPPKTWLDSVLKAAEWIEEKRAPKSPGIRHGGLLPAGFSAEHLGPNDYYYWDDFWGLAGLKAASKMAGQFHSRAMAERFNRFYQDFYKCIFGSIAAIPEAKSKNAIPASPYRRMDAGAIGSLVADYPLQVTPAAEPRIMETVEYLMNDCFHKGAFFQDMIHSGINAYLTLDIAQSLLRAGDPRYKDLIEKVAELATSTGQWPEAIHPHSLGGCMGDGQHGWAAAEWVVMIRNLFVREEENHLIIGSGIFGQWLSENEPLFFGPTPTPHGPVSVTLTPAQGRLEVQINGQWRSRCPDIFVQVPGYENAAVEAGSQDNEMRIEVCEK
ncbi:hypothetical protein HNR65_000755 [Desulfosalsimonas propionicica]|uniref:Uncharacterized protein n=1 Tax=Desulfosalsimonas propionicica TaxID=332175 RepID=A0A7W0C792_9BACT|nr:hypothetical protein [Desulfosalsimonas propionicica]MBA2880437.1 hypothetical protein [Desulfosalsimonas propionicica]